MEPWNLRPESISKARLEFGAQSVIIAEKKGFSIKIKNDISNNFLQFSPFDSSLPFLWDIELKSCPVLVSLKKITSKSGREYFRLGAESYSSLGRVGKK